MTKVVFQFSSVTLDNQKLGRETCPGLLLHMLDQLEGVRHNFPAVLTWKYTSDTANHNIHEAHSMPLVTHS